MARTRHRNKIDKDLQPVAYKRKARVTWQREYGVLAA